MASHNCRKSQKLRHGIMSNSWILRTIRRVFTRRVLGGWLLCMFACVFILFLLRGPKGAIRDFGSDSTLPAFLGTPATANPLSAKPVQPHPFLSTQGTMHADSYNSAVQDWHGPLGNNPQIISRSMDLLAGLCVMSVFDERGHMASVSASFDRFRLTLLDPDNLDVIDQYDLPVRQSTWSFDLDQMTNDTSGGSYFYFDRKGRAIVANAANVVEIVEIDRGSDQPQWRQVASYDLTGHLPAGQVITSAIPDWHGRLWFVTRKGVVGMIDDPNGPYQNRAPASDQPVWTTAKYSAYRVYCKMLKGEEIQNSFAVAADGVYLVSDHAMYGFAARADSTMPEFDWRAPYDRGSEVKAGQANQGSGTTPTLLGDDYVAICDNADGRVNLLVYRRQVDNEDQRLACTVPLFDEGRSSAENSVIGYGRSVVVQNTLGAPGPFGDYTSLVPGMVRIDISEDGNSFEQVWKNDIATTTSAKLSTATGLIYSYTQLLERAPKVKAWYFTAIDFRTGETVYRVHVGNGLHKHNFWGTTVLGPDGTAYQGVFNGILAIRDN